MHRHFSLYLQAVIDIAQKTQTNITLSVCIFCEERKPSDIFVIRNNYRRSKKHEDVIKVTQISFSICKSSNLGAVHKGLRTSSKLSNFNFQPPSSQFLCLKCHHSVNPLSPRTSSSFSKIPYENTYVNTTYILSSRHCLFVKQGWIICMLAHSTNLHHII